MKLVLASDSARRKHLLSWMGLEFEAISHKVDEETVKLNHVDPEILVGQLAMDKATSVDGELVIGSDLVVNIGKKILGKPKDKREAKKFLKLLSGKKHIVWCGVCVTDKEKTLLSVATSDVKMKNYDEKIIDEYIKKFEVLDKGGAYAIQFELPGYGSLVESFKGGITTIIGLPMEYLENLLKEFGVKPKKDWRQACKIETGYEN